MVVAKVKSCPKEVLTRIEKSVTEEKAGLFDMHPTDRDRIARGHVERRPGVFRAEGQATTLFRDFDELCRAVTVEHYRKVLGNDFSQKNLVETDGFIGERVGDREKGEAAARYFQGQATPLRPLFLGKRARAPFDRDRLLDARRRFEGLLPRAADARKKFGRGEELRLNALCAENLLKAELRIRAAAYDLPSPTLEGVEQVRASAQNLQDETRGELETIESVLRERLEAALDGVLDPVKAKRVDDLVAALGVLGEVYPTLDEIREIMVGQEALFANLAGQERYNALNAIIDMELLSVRRLLKTVHAALLSASYPYEHVHGEVSLSEVLVGTIPPLHDWRGIYATAKLLVDGYYDVYARLMRELAKFAEEAEANVDMKPIS